MRRFGWIAGLMIAASMPAMAHGQGRTGKSGTATGPASCPYEPLGTGRVVAAKDGRSLILDDGREVRLAGIEPPAAETEPGRAAAAALAAWAGGRSVALRRIGPERDRYGRVLAHVFVEGETPEQSLQHRLLAAGHARATASGGCVTESLRFERQARTANLGLWGDPYYQVKRAEHAPELLAQRGRFAIVEGTVLSVRESGGTIYVNFGRRWSEDFTATIPKRSERAFAAAGMEPKGLARRRIRVRGWIEERGGPWIDLVGPEQIEIAERK